MIRPTRRNLLAGAAVLTAAPGAGQAENHPDAALIAVCAAFDACDRRATIITGTGPGCVKDDDEAEAASAPFYTRMGELLDRMAALRAATPAGIQARAFSLAQHGGEWLYSFGDRDTIVGELLFYLLRDAAALGGSPEIVRDAAGETGA